MNIISKEETYSGEAIVVDSKQIQINYPFGYFQFSDSITKYLTVSRYSYISLADSIRSQVWC